VLAAVGVLGAAAASWFYRNGYLLYYGDALAHLNIARRLTDSRTLNYGQIGTVWLPVPHLLWAPWARGDELWRSGLAGTFPTVACFALAGMALFLLLRRVTENRAAALAGTAVLALNPNLLYLQSTAMTEPMALCFILGALWMAAEAAHRNSAAWAAIAGLSAAAACLTRYEAWFLLPFLTAYMFWSAGWRAGVAFCFLAGWAPLYWLAHNWWLYGDVLEFYRGPYSAQAIYERSLERGVQPYPGDGSWWLSLRYYLAAMRLTLGWPLLILGAAGLAVAIRRKAGVAAAALLALLPAFYVASMYSSGTPIFVPHLPPFTRYNTRYGLAALPLLAFAVATLVNAAPSRFRAWSAAGLAALALSPWLFTAWPESSVVWRESVDNSATRRAWTAEAGGFLRTHYRGGGIATSFGDLTGALTFAGVPIRESLYEDNGLQWDTLVARPDLFLKEEWVLAFSGDALSNAVFRAQRNGPYYDLVRRIEVPGARVVEIWRRGSQARLLRPDSSVIP
jgi:4-amino-4-deoxy-L-arabinose transferase-like glycosyltransferase